MMTDPFDLLNQSLVDLNGNDLFCIKRKKLCQRSEPGPYLNNCIFPCYAAAGDDLFKDVGQTGNAVRRVFSSDLSHFCRMSEHDK